MIETITLAQESSASPTDLTWWSAIKDVNNPYALLAFFSAAGLTSLFMIIKFTGGLESAQRYLLQNAALSAQQVERVFIFTITAFASLTVCLFVYLGFSGWLDKQTSHEVINEPYVGITYPGENEYVSVSQNYPQITVKGESRAIPKDEKIWIFAYPVGASRFFPFQSHAIVEADGDWSSTEYIGPIDKASINYEFLAAGVDENARYVISEYLKKQKETQQYLGLDTPPNGSNIYARREVSFTPDNVQ